MPSVAVKKYSTSTGISESDDAKDDRSGYTVFKQSFGGEIVEYAGAWEIPVDPIRYHLKQGFHTIHKAIKRGN